jgi:signal transduction histidine kinase
MQRYAPQARADRVISVSRFLLALFGLAALRLDPDLIPVRLGPPIAVLTVYALYALVLLIVPIAEYFDSQRLRLVLLVVDFVVFSAVIAVTHGAASPFFVFFVFSLFCATLRFGMRGTIVTAISAAVIYLVIAISLETVRSDPGFLVLRLSYLTVVTLFLLHLARYQQRARDDLLSIGAWPREVPPHLDALLAQNVRSAAALMTAPRVVAALEETDEPWTTVAELRDQHFSAATLPPGMFDEIVAPMLHEATFFIRDGVTVVRGGRGAKIARDAALSPPFRDRFDLASTLSAPVSGEMLSGRIFFAGRTDWSSDDLALADIAARLFSSQIDQFSAQERLRRAAVVEERIRVARDLHDGVLQSLTGLALQIESLIQETGDAALRGRLAALQDLIANEQRELRSFVTQLRPNVAESVEPPLGARLRALAERIAQQWNVAVDVTLEPPSPALPVFMASEVYSLVNESLANAAKHARASRVTARVTVGGDEVQIRVEDDGTGFPFAGTYDLRRLDAERRGPVTLRERIASLGGDLVLESSPRGSRIEMRIEF